MKEPEIKIELNKYWTKSHVYINGEEIPVLRLEIAPMDGNQQLVRARIEVLVDELHISPDSVEWIKHKLGGTEEE